MPIIPCLAVLGLSWALVFGLTPLAIRLGERLHLVAEPGGRRKHHGAIVRIGGLTIFPAFCSAALLSLRLDVPRGDLLENTRLIGTLIGMGIVWLLGIIDDWRPLPVRVQLIGLVVASLVAIGHKVFIEIFNSPFSETPIIVDWYLMLPITIIWLVGMTGTLNVLDGLDGLAAGVTALASLVLFVHMLRLQQYSVALLPLALLGCCLGFLPYNFYPARIFLGGGAYLLGFTLGALAIIAGAKVASALLILWLPILDLMWQILSRWRRGQPVGLGDRGHLHFRLLDMGWPQGRVVLLYYSITACLGAIALYSPSRLLKLGVLLGGGILILIALMMISRRLGEETPTGR